MDKLMDQFKNVAQRAKNMELGRIVYSLPMIHAVQQAICCGYKKITVIELGVAGGNGIKNLYKISKHLHQEFGIEIDVIGFDTGTGLPEIKDYRDHPEIWSQGDFSMEYKIDEFPTDVRLILGNVADTIPEFVKTFDGILGFVSLDLDLYSSTVSAFPLFEMPAHRYLPAMPVYVDDINVLIGYNPWCGEALAIKEFNDSHPMRKIEEKSSAWHVQNFHVFHVLDHAIRNGVEKPLHPLTIEPFY